jgi:hypothetical protein
MTFVLCASCAEAEVAGLVNPAANAYAPATRATISPDATIIAERLFMLRHHPPVVRLDLEMV